MTTWAAAAALVASAALAACGGGGGDERVEVFAASSLRGALDGFGGGGVRYTFAGSDELAAQIRDGARADLFLSASRGPIDGLREHGLVEEPVVFASNRLVVVVPRANPGRVRAFADLARPGLKVVLAAEGVPIGDYAREALTAAGVDLGDNVVSLEQDAKGVLGKVALGEADAGVVYATDADAGDVEAVAIPEAVQPRIAYYAALTDRGGAAAAGVLAALRGEEGERALAAAGFLPPP
ncbi:MAG TPA: molybdate ABC transporter substrate-binding protein [Gaiellaceae bacterium]|nr:molybdate ABC transporter substrate-binding protein [Gaiellaceae bacterium]